MKILGINTFFHDSSAAIVVNGKLLASADEERFNREKHSTAFPTQAIRSCLSQVGLRPSDLDGIAFSRDPRARFREKASFFLKNFPRSLPMLSGRFRNWSKIYSLDEQLEQALGEPYSGKIHRVRHHLAHAASAYFCSPFDSAAVLSIDGGGDFASTLLAKGEGNELHSLQEVGYPDSLGMIYTLVTLHIGFGAGDEGKTMGLAPYGEPEFLDRFREIIQVTKDGLFRIDPSYFRYQLRGADYFTPANVDVRQLVSGKFLEAFGPPRKSDEPLTQHHQNLARSLQERLEEVVFEILNTLHQKTGSRRLCLAGGVALNSVLNGKILEKTPFEELFVQPAAGDGGTAIGAALSVGSTSRGFQRHAIDNAYFGPGFLDRDVAASLGEVSDGSLHVIRSDRPSKEAAQLLSEGLILGWFQGRMEIGPRALGNRSILANPAVRNMKEILNARVKFREGFRPFAPSAPWESAKDFFEVERETPFMLEVCKVKPQARALLPAITHVDGSARLQTVRSHQNEIYHSLLVELGRKTGIPVALNTSFNVKGEPIVCTPTDALRCFRGTNIDALVMGSHVILKKETVEKRRQNGEQPSVVAKNPVSA